VVVPIVVVVEVVVILIVVFVAGPAFGLLGLLQVELVPSVQIDLFDVAVLVLHLDELLLGIPGQHAEELGLLQVFVPLSLNRVVVSAHKTPQTKETGASPAAAY